MADGNRLQPVLQLQLIGGQQIGEFAQIKSIEHDKARVQVYGYKDRILQPQKQMEVTTGQMYHLPPRELEWAKGQLSDLSKIQFEADTSRHTCQNNIEPI